jgi:hypothetical protein
MMHQTIELDCAPGNPRPGDLLPGVLEGTGIPVREAVSKLFGNWTFDYSDIPADQWEKAKPIIKARIEALYHAGRIRYGSW